MKPNRKYLIYLKGAVLMGDFNYDTYCGLYCGACSIVKAYQNGIKDPLACLLGGEFGIDLKCHGCKTDSVFGNCAVCPIRKCTHAFDLFNDEPRTHEIIEQTLEFLKQHLWAL